VASWRWPNSSGKLNTRPAKFHIADN